MAPSSGSPVFVHFMPMPLRAEGKKHLPWIVHTSDGSACLESAHVVFKTLVGFETYEGCPPDQTCKCTVSNHHLRGHGRVRWEGTTAVIECADDDENRLVNVASFRDDAKRQAREVSGIRTELRRLKEDSDKTLAANGQLKARVIELERIKLEHEGGPLREAEVRTPSGPPHPPLGPSSPCAAESACSACACARAHPRPGRRRGLASECLRALRVGPSPGPSAYRIVSGQSTYHSLSLIHI